MDLPLNYHNSEEKHQTSTVFLLKQSKHYSLFIWSPYVNTLISWAISREALAVKTYLKRFSGYAFNLCKVWWHSLLQKKKKIPSPAVILKCFHTKRFPTVCWVEAAPANTWMVLPFDTSFAFSRVSLLFLDTKQHIGWWLKKYRGSLLGSIEVGNLNDPLKKKTQFSSSKKSHHVVDLLHIDAF